MKHLCTRWLKEGEKEEWLIGERNMEKSVLKFGFKKTKLIEDKGTTKFYYDEEELKEFQKAMERIGEKEFEDICDNFIEKFGKVKLRELVLAYTIFDEFDNHPEYMNSGMSRRLMRVRETTECTFDAETAP